MNKTMRSSESPKKELNEKCTEISVKFVSNLRSGKLEGSNNIAIATTSLLEQIICDSKSASAFELLGVVLEVGKLLSNALPQELIVANMVRRVLRAIRDEYKTHNKQNSEGGAGGSLQQMVLATPPRRMTLNLAEQDLQESLRDHIAELQSELESSTTSICSTAREHVHADELILTYGASNLVEKFLRTCMSRKFKLILLEGPTTAKSHAMARRLSAAGVPVTIISNAAVYAVMSRINKVIVGVRAVLAGGAVLAHAGMHGVSLAAKHFSVPVIALAPLYKLTPLYACDEHHFNLLAPPHQTLSYESIESSLAHVYAPLCDFVPPDHITLFITNLGGISPSYIYRLLSELYDAKDYRI